MLIQRAGMLERRTRMLLEGDRRPSLRTGGSSVSFAPLGVGMGLVTVGAVLAYSPRPELVATATVVAAVAVWLRRRTSNLVHRSGGVPSAHRSFGMSDPSPDNVALTPVERTILRLIADGSSDYEIAQELHVSRAAVRQLLATAISKLGGRHLSTSLEMAAEPPDETAARPQERGPSAD
jgi:DNA-binding CsgD family transcriptional regulator